MYNLVFKVKLKLKIINKIFLGSGSGPQVQVQYRSRSRSGNLWTWTRGPGPGSAKSARTGPGLDLGQSISDERALHSRLYSVRGEMEELDIGAFPAVNAGFQEIEVHVKRKYK